MPGKILPAIVCRTVWKQTMEEQAGKICDGVAENVRKGMGGNKGEIVPIDKYDGYKTKSKRPDRNEGGKSA